jgi:Peptidase family M23
VGADPRVWGLASVLVFVLAMAVVVAGWARSTAIGSGGGIWRPARSFYSRPEGTPSGTPLHADVKHWLCGHTGQVPCDKPLLGCRFHDPKYPEHVGVDFPTAIGIPVETTMGGKVIWAGAAGEWGNLVVVENAFTAVYFAHLSSIQVQVGDALSRGDVVGKTSSTGNSTGPHLHDGVLRYEDGHPDGVWIDPETTFSPYDYYPVPCGR